MVKEGEKAVRAMTESFVICCSAPLVCEKAKKLL